MNNDLKETVGKKADEIIAKRKENYDHVCKCMSAKICPICGEPLVESKIRKKWFSYYEVFKCSVVETHFYKEYYIDDSGV